MATFSEMHASTSRKYAAEQIMLMPNCWKRFQSFWLRSSRFVLEKQPKNSNFKSFLPLRDNLVAT